MQISIAPELQARWPQTALGVLVYEVQVAPSSPALLARFDQTAAQLASRFTLDTIAQQPHIAATRQAYKALGGPPPTTTATPPRPCSAAWSSRRGSTTSTTWWR